MHHGEQVFGHGLGGLTCGDVSEQRLPRQVQAALGAQHARRDRRYRAAGVAETGHQPEGAQAVKAALEGVLADRVVDDLDALSPGDLLHARHKVFAAVVDGMGRAMLQRQCAFGRAAGRAYELQPQRPRPLAGNQTHTPCGSVKQHKVTGLQSLDRQRLLQQVLRGQPLQHHAGCRVEGNAVGQAHHVLGRHHARFAVAARRVAGIGGAVAGLQVRDANAYRLDDAGAFHAQRQRQRVGVQACALVHIDVIQPARVMADANLTWPGFAHLALDKVHLLGAAVSGDLDGA